MESQGGSGTTDGGGGDGQSGQAASTALIEKILSEEPRWQGNIWNTTSGGIQAEKQLNLCYVLSALCSYLSTKRKIICV